MFLQNARLPPFFVAKKYSIVYIHILRFLHPSIHPRTPTSFPRPGYCQQRCNEPAGVALSSRPLFSFPLDTCPEVGLLDHMVVLFLIF